jgi:mannose-6-phosphate isomerase
MGLAIDSERRSFRDAGHKPELLCALTPFRAMCGFRRPEDIRELLARLCPQELAPELEQFEGGCHAAGLARLFRALLKIKGASPDRCRRVVSEARRNAGRLGGLAGHWVMELAGRFTDDIGVLSPALLNVLELNPGQALFLPAGIIHAYLSGTGVEIMANSDNVVRGGLTPKHMDVDLLMSVLSFESHFGHRVEPEDAGPCEKAFPTPAEEFALSAIRTRPEAVFESKKERPVEILLCTEGAAVLEPCDDAGPVDLLRGVSVLVPAAAAAYRLKGDATVFKATLP